MAAFIAFGTFVVVFAWVYLAGMLYVERRWP